jgi:hypothetical protein
MQMAGYRTGGSWWQKAALAGLYGGIAMALYAMVISWALGHGFWRPLDMIGGTVPAFRTQGGGLWQGTLTGLAIHLVSSVAWGLIYGAVVAAAARLVAPQLGRSWFNALFLGLAFGALSYVGTGVLVGPLMDPALAWMDAYPFFVAHIVFGLVTALAFTGLVRRPNVRVTFAPAETRLPTTPRGSR